MSKKVELDLAHARELIAHEGEKGGASEEVWRRLLRKYLPLRYQIDTGFVVDSTNSFSEQIDIVVFDRQYSPLVFELAGRKISPAESVYAVIEVKQVLNAANLAYAKDKVSGVRRLHRTNLPVPNLNGEPVQRSIPPISGEILTLESDWSPVFGKAFRRSFAASTPQYRLDFGCVASTGWFDTTPDGTSVSEAPFATTKFLFAFISHLQRLGTVPMIDMSAYSQHIK